MSLSEEDSPFKKSESFTLRGQIVPQEAWVNHRNYWKKQNTKKGCLLCQQVMSI
jgi:hypothetical protein